MTNSPATYAEFVAHRDALQSQMNAASAIMRSFQSLPSGLTPDAVKALPEWQAANSAYRTAFAGLRALNGAHLARFKSEETARRAITRQSGQA